MFAMFTRLVVCVTYKSMQNYFKQHLLITIHASFMNSLIERLHGKVHFIGHTAEQFQGKNGIKWILVRGPNTPFPYTQINLEFDQRNVQEHIMHYLVISPFI